MGLVAKSDIGLQWPEALAEVLKMIGRNSEVVRFGSFRFKPGDGLWQAGRPVALPPRALGVLTALLATPGAVVSKQQLMDAVWPGTFVTESSLLEAVGLVREALGDDRRKPMYVQTVHRRGYRFIGRLETPEAAAEFPPFFSGPEWRPIVLACATYAVTTVCVAIVFAVFGQTRVDRPVATVRAVEVAENDRGVRPVRFAVSHTGALFMLPRDGEAISPSWTPDGLEIAFAFSKAGPFNVLGTWQQFPTSWSHDGRQLAFTERHPLSGADIWLLDVGSGARRALVRTTFDETWARFSPDGRRIAYMSNQSGRWEVYVRPASGAGDAVRISTNGGAWPSWSSDGATVYFSADGRADLRIVLDWFSELASRIRPS
jgi:DNA-binding winged helix-turn-helix (wHTH) protein